jgi:hypothetical protein
VSVIPEPAYGNACLQNGKRELKPSGRDMSHDSLSFIKTKSIRMLKWTNSPAST